MRLDERLNLIIPVYKDDAAEQIAGYVYSMPLPRVMFEAHYRLVASTFTAVMQDGLGEIGGPKVAALMLKEVAANKKLDPSPLLNEIQRSTTYYMETGNGWDMIPLHSAIVRGDLNEDDAAEVMNALVFFIVASAMLPKTVNRDLVSGSARISGASTSSLPFMEWIGSSKTSTGTENTGATPHHGTGIQVDRPS